MTTESLSARIDAAASQSASAPVAPASGTYVINLCSSTTPMALRIPELPELKRFVFFVSRRREEGRERFRLHMGHFATLPEAEEWLSVVRELYPGAWAGEAPGKKLRAAQEAAAAAAAVAQAASLPAIETPSAAPVAAPMPSEPAQRPAVERRAAARPPATPAKPVAPPKAPPPQTPPPQARTAAPRARAIPEPQRPPPGGGQSSRAATAAPAARPPRPPPPAASIPVVQAAKFAAPVPSQPPAVATSTRAALQPSNVRQVLADLDGAEEAGRTRQMPMPPPRASVAPRPAVVAEAAGLTDTQVLKMLERRRDAGAKAPPTPVLGAPEEIQLLRPDDLSTMTELRHGLSGNRQVFFAVQLEWSVRPIELKKVPPLAIFSAYTLYTVEGSREDRKWYGLRLGFFSDSISAKQVALYVRSEFKSVAVVPVGGSEKTRATEDGKLSSSALGQAHHRDQPVEEFKLLDETAENPRLVEPAPAAPIVPPRPPARAAQGAGSVAPKELSPGSGTAKGPLAQRLARAPGTGREKTSEEALEETLEILGASHLSLDDGRKPLINDNQVRPASVSVETTGTFAKLLERLSDRLSRSR